VVTSPPKALLSNKVSSSIQLTLPLASGRAKPFATNDFVPRSNSRNTTASLPPRDSRTIARSCFIGRVPAPPQIQSSPSAIASASRSISTSQSGVSLRKLSGVVRRQRPRGCAASVQKL
jgi:hypothetical protein